MQLPGNQLEAFRVETGFWLTCQAKKKQTKRTTTTLGESQTQTRPNGRHFCGTRCLAPTEVTPGFNLPLNSQAICDIWTGKTPVATPNPFPHVFRGPSSDFPFWFSHFSLCGVLAVGNNYIAQAFTLILVLLCRHEWLHNGVPRWGAKCTSTPCRIVTKNSKNFGLGTVVRNMPMLLSRSSSWLLPTSFPAVLHLVTWSSPEERKGEYVKHIATHEWMRVGSWGGTRLCKVPNLVKSPRTAREICWLILASL